MIAPYLALVNRLLHLAFAMHERRYNPGLWTGLALLLPVGGEVARERQATRRDHLWGVGGAILIHVLIVLGILFAGKTK